MLAGAEVHMQAETSSPRYHDLRVGAGAFAEVDGLAAEVAAELRDVRVDAVEKRNAVSRAARLKLKFGARNSCLALGKILNVRGADVGHNTPVGRGNAGQSSDLAQVIHAHFDNGILVFRLKSKQLQRHAKRVIEIALRPQHFETCAAAQPPRLLLWWSFPAEPVIATTRLAPLSANVRCQRLQRNQRIFRDEQREPSTASGNVETLARETTAATAPRSRAADYKIVTVKTLSAHGKKQVARRCGSRINGVAGSDQRAGAARMLEGASRTAPAPMAASASVSFIVPHHIPIRAERRVQFQCRRTEWYGRRESAPSRGLCLQSEQHRLACGFQREINGAGAVGLDGVRDAAGFERRLNFGKNGPRVFVRGLSLVATTKSLPAPAACPSWGAWCGRDRRRSQRA